MPLLTVRKDAQTVGRFEWSDRPVVIGRDAAADIDLSPLDDLSISRSHARIEPSASGYAIHDTGARNSITVNGRIATRHELQDGDEIGVGGVVLIFMTGQEPEAASALVETEGASGARLEGVPCLKAAMPAKAPQADETKTVVLPLGSAPRDWETLQISHQRLLLLYDLSRRFYASTDLSGLLDAVLSAICRLMGAERALATILEDGTPALALGHNLAVGSNRKLWPVSHTILDRVLEQNCAVLADDACSDPELNQAQSVRRLQVRSVICCPLKEHGRPIGLLYADNPARTAAFSQSDLDLLRILAVHVEAALGVARSKQEILAQNAQLRRENQRLKRPERQIASILGNSEAILSAIERVHDIARLPADARVSVLIMGDTGTGKELIAREIHARAGRSRGPFVPVNCAAIPENLMESELFGIESGVATGVAARPGLFETAQGGVLFLDEIADMPLLAQAKLLRALQERSISRVGGRKQVAVDAWVMAASNRDLKEEVKAGRFRDDLYYRLSVLEITLPPLSERGDDVRELATFFLDKYAREFGKAVHGFAPDALAAVVGYGWPGNVRELENTLAGCVAFCRGHSIGAADLPPHIARLHARADEPLISMEEMERQHLSKVLEATGGNITQAAEILELGRQAVYQKIERYGLKRPGSDV